VSNDIERELAKILARDNELRDAEASEKRKQEAAVAAAVIEWESRVEKVLLPAIEPLAAMLKGAGWTCDIERTPQGFKVAAFRGDMVVYGSRERPSLSFELQKGKDLVTLHEATPSGVRLDSKILGGLALNPMSSKIASWSLSVNWRWNKTRLKFARRSFDLWWEWAEKLVDSMLTIDADIHEAVMALPPDEGRDRAKVKEAVREGLRRGPLRPAGSEDQ
jgi:hypothetical protein